MCDLHSRRYGYICNECFEELVSRGILSHEAIEHFMNCPPKPIVEDKSREYYEEIFENRGPYG
jgi:hypothetical protein